MTDEALIQRARIAAKKLDEKLYADLADRLEALLAENKALRNRK